MSDAQLAFFLSLILARINNEIDVLETRLCHSEFCEMVGEQGNIFNPYGPSYPILEGLYALRGDLSQGIDKLKASQE